MMNAPAEKSSPKTNSPKPEMDHQKAINQLRQEIKVLSKTVKEMQQKPDIQVVNIAIPKGLLSRANSYLLEYAKEIGEVMSLSEFICEAMDMCLYGEELNKRLEEERRKAELESHR